MVRMEDLDDSGLYELRLSELLREREPDLDITRVDLSPFEPPKAKIDCIKLGWPYDAEVKVLEEMGRLMEGRVKFPNDVRGEAFLAIQDPTLDDLRFIQKHFPDTDVRHIEVAVDFRLPTGSNDQYLLRRLKEQLRHCLAPHEHPEFVQPERVYFDTALNHWRQDAAANDCPYTTIRYESRSGMSMKIYIKTKDQKLYVPEPFVRLELTLRSSAIVYAGLNHVRDFPIFVHGIRKFCMKAFSIGKSFKSNDPDGEKWKNKGAVWSFKPSKRLAVKGDVGVQKAIGCALNELRRSLKRALPQKKARKPGQ